MSEEARYQLKITNPNNNVSWFNYRIEPDDFRIVSNQQDAKDFDYSTTNALYDWVKNVLRKRGSRSVVTIAASILKKKTVSSNELKLFLCNASGYDDLLPKLSTLLSFAYSIEEAIGKATLKAKETFPNVKMWQIDVSEIGQEMIDAIAKLATKALSSEPSSDVSQKT